MEDVLGEDDSLELNDEEVDELLRVFQGCFQSLSWNCVILPGPEGRSQTLREDGLTGKLSGSRSYIKS